MMRFCKWVGVTIGLVLLSGVWVAGSQWLEAAAEGPVQIAAGWGAPHIDLVVDSSASMGPELAVLAEVWDDTDIVHLQNAIYGRLTYTDSVSVLPPTTEPAFVQAWLEDLEAAGGGSCPDAALQALMAAAAMSNPQTNLGDTRALLLSDSAPEGGRTALARTTHRLLRQGVRVYPVQSGWCWNESPITMEAITLLAQMTGGTAFPVVAGTSVTNTQMALNLMAAGDDLLNVSGVVTDQVPSEHTFNVDSTVGSLILQLDDARCCPCLTCTLQLSAPQEHCHIESGCGPYTMTVRLPGGQIIGADDPGVTLTGTDYGVQMKISSINQTPMPAGIYQLQIEGHSAYELRVAANAGIHMAYLGMHSIPAGHPLNVRVALLLPAIQGGPMAANAGGPLPATLTSAYVPLDGTPTLPGGTLYDDGQHQDGAPGDGIFGGLATLPPGAYRLMIRGELADGSVLQRVDPSPIRARQFDLPSPDARRVQAGTSVTYTFSLTNEGDTSETFDLLAESSQGWAMTSTVPISSTLAPGETLTMVVPVQIPPGTPPGTVEETTLTAVGADLLASEMALARTSVAGEFDIYLPILRRE